MEKLKIDELEKGQSTEVWSVRDYCERVGANAVEQARLVTLFGPFATAAELRHNTRREQRFRSH